MKGFNVVFGSLLAASSGLAAPVAPPTTRNVDPSAGVNRTKLVARQSGETFSGIASYHSDWSSTACGSSEDGANLITAIDKTQYEGYGAVSNASPVCGKQITVSAEGKQIQVTVVDRKETESGALDLSEAAFQQFRELGQGTFPVEWWFTGGNPADGPVTNPNADGSITSNLPSLGGGGGGTTSESSGSASNDDTAQPDGQSSALPSGQTGASSVADPAASASSATAADPASPSQWGSGSGSGSGSGAGSDTDSQANSQASVPAATAATAAGSGGVTSATAAATNAVPTQAQVPAESQGQGQGGRPGGWGGSGGYGGSGRGGGPGRRDVVGRSPSKGTCSK